MFYMSGDSGRLKILILESADLDGLKNGRPLKTPDNSVLMVLPPDPTWLADEIMKTNTAEKIHEAIEKSLKQSAKSPSHSNKRSYMRRFLTIVGLTSFLGLITLSSFMAMPQDQKEKEPKTQSKTEPKVEIKKEEVRSNSQLTDAYAIICESQPDRVIVLDSTGKWLANVKIVDIKLNVGSPIAPAATMSCTMYEGQVKPSEPQVKTWRLIQLKTLSAHEFQQKIDSLQTDPNAIKTMAKE